MSIEIKVPAMGESVTEATIARWLKKEGDSVKQDEPLVELETDKVSVEVPSPAAGVLEHISVQAGRTVGVGAVLGAVAEGAAGQSAAPAAKAEAPSPRPKRRAGLRAGSPRRCRRHPLPCGAHRRGRKVDVSAIAGSGSAAR